jgi:hypothetical protein
VSTPLLLLSTEPPLIVLAADECFKAIVTLQGRDFQKDNLLVWQLLRHFVVKMAAWNCVKHFDVTQGGC